MVKLMVKHTSTAVCAPAVLLVCTKAMLDTPAQDFQQQMRQQHASQGLASAGQIPYLAMHLIPRLAHDVLMEHAAAVVQVNGVAD